MSRVIEKKAKGKWIFYRLDRTVIGFKKSGKMFNAMLGAVTKDGQIFTRIFAELEELPEDIKTEEEFQKWADEIRKHAVLW